MMKKLENRSKKDIIDFLSVDPIFGVYTRKYMDYLIVTKNMREIYIIDFDRIGKLNVEIGYEEVNKKFRKVFKKKTDGVYIGRFFSGDEMIIAFEKSWEQRDEIKFIKKLKKRAKKQELNFKSLHIGLSDSEHPGSTSGMDGGHDIRHSLWANKIEKLKHSKK